MPFLPFSSFERALPTALLLATLALTAACDRPIVPRTQAAGRVPESRPAQEAPSRRQIRATGTVRAIRSYSLQTPQITGQGGRLTLTDMAPNGAIVKAGDIVAEFDRTQQLDNA